jgi:hypothetical protein
MSEHERLYLEHRAEVEIAWAQAFEHPAVVRSHYLLPDYYLDRLYGQDNDAEQQQTETRSWAGQGRC